MEASGAPSQPQALLLHLQSFSPENIAHNAKQLYYIRSVFTSVAGSAAGIFGLTNFDGFYWYIASLILTNIAVFIINVRFQPRRYLLSFNPAKDTLSKKDNNDSGKSPALTAWQYVSFVIEGAQEMAFGYVLWWTLWYAIIHVYD